MADFSPSLTALPDIRLARRETHPDRSYQWDNQTRKPDRGLVIQRTVCGSCGFTKGSVHTEVLPDQAMLFRHGEHSRYGITPDSSLPYETEYLVMDPGGGVAELFEGLRAQYGPVLRMEADGTARRILLQLLIEFESNRPSDRISRAESLYLLLLNLFREQGRDARGRDPVAYGRHLLETRYREPGNLKEWCAEIGISREHFSREFTARYRETPAEFLRNLRLSHARGLLNISTRMSLEDVAALSGFASVQTFQRAYKRRFGHPATRTKR
ncbi:MAG: AraC family transcriptional regulator [Verrucomicrobia bacterium]|nr:AraC family transcriptional regulator [Verrucomicrobiota bacterium]MCH8528357.1 helix-turn-helix domain-containing protein [Kiritimatiellia bacterium]